MLINEQMFGILVNNLAFSWESNTLTRLSCAPFFFKALPYYPPAYCVHDLSSATCRFHLSVNKKLKKKDIWCTQVTIGGGNSFFWRSALRLSSALLHYLPPYLSDSLSTSRLSLHNPPCHTHTTSWTNSMHWAHTHTQSLWCIFPLCQLYWRRPDWFKTTERGTRQEQGSIPVIWRQPGGWPLEG